MLSTIPVSRINDTLSVITATCGIDIIDYLSPGRMRWAPAVTQRAGNGTGISVCSLPKVLFLFSPSTENTNATSFAGSPASSPCGGHGGCWFMPLLIVSSEPRTRNSFTLQSTHVDEGQASLWLVNAWVPWKSGSLVRTLRFDRTSVSSNTADINRAAARLSAGWACASIANLFF